MQSNFATTISFSSATTVVGSTPKTLRIEVTDDGEGVPLEAQARLFMPFFTTRATGTGLGLALVKRIVEAHGGTVAHETPPPPGALHSSSRFPSASATRLRAC